MLVSCELCNKSFKYKYKRKEILNIINRIIIIGNAVAIALL